MRAPPSKDVSLLFASISFLIDENLRHARSSIVVIWLSVKMAWIRCGGNASPCNLVKPLLLSPRRVSDVICARTFGTLVMRLLPSTNRISSRVHFANVAGKSVRSLPPKSSFL